MVMTSAARSKPLGSHSMIGPLKPASRTSSATEGAMPAASKGLPANFSTASCALKVSNSPASLITLPATFTSLSLLMKATAMSGLCPLLSAALRKYPE